MANIFIGDIKSSICTPQLIKDDFVRNGYFLQTKLGDPIMFTGGFSVVFPCIVNGEKWALRCWHTGLGNMQKRFQLLSTALDNNRLPYFCDFKYVDEGIIVNGNIYPTTRMRWVEGLTIKDYICEHLGDSKCLRSLADNFMQMCKYMHINHFAHGDLQHGNIMVDDKGKLYLIDYDSLYHISMGDMPDNIHGVKDYQHPARTESVRATEKLDYFSELIIYTATLAIAENPSLAEKYQLEDADNMLFKAEDFKDLLNSDVYNDIYSLGGIFPILLDILSVYLSYNDINELSPMNEMLDNMLGEPKIISFNVQEETIYDGDEITLVWQSEHVLKQSINGKVYDKGISSCKWKLNNATSIKIEASNFRKSVTKTLKIKPLPTPKIHFISSKQRIRTGGKEPFNITWKVTNAKSVNVYDTKDKKEVGHGLEGMRTLTCTDKTKYEIVVTGLDGKRQFRKDLEIEVLPACEVVFSVDKRFSFPDVPVTVSWTVKDAESVHISGKGKVEDSGAYIICPQQDTTITLNVKDNFGIHNYRQTIRMLPLPSIKISSSMPHFNNKISIRTKMPQIQASLPNTMVKVPSPIGMAEMDISQFGFCKEPQFTCPRFELKNETFWQGLYEIAKHYLTTISNKFNRTINNER